MMDYLFYSALAYMGAAALTFEWLRDKEGKAVGAPIRPKYLLFLGVAAFFWPLWLPRYLWDVVIDANNPEDKP